MRIIIVVFICYYDNQIVCSMLYILTIVCTSNPQDTSGTQLPQERSSPHMLPHIFKKNKTQVLGRSQGIINRSHMGGFRPINYPLILSTCSYLPAEYGKRHPGNKFNIKDKFTWTNFIKIRNNNILWEIFRLILSLMYVHVLYSD